METKLEVLQCHFTWDLDLSRATLFHFKDKLEDIGADEGNSWLAHIYNLQGYIHQRLGLNEGAKRFFSRAADVFQQRQTASHDGPWLMVNYGNQAWLHHHLGEEAESQEYLSKVDALMNEYPPPSQDELHPEIYAEKAWTLMKFSRDKTLVLDYFEKAIRMQPDMVEWQTSRSIALMNVFKERSTELNDDILEKMRNAKEQDPENLYLAVHYLDQCAKKGERIEDEARELAQKILRNPVSSYSGMKELLMIYMKYISADEAIDLAEEALQKHPDERYLKRCAALCYKWKIIYFRDGQSPEQRMIDRATSLLREVISLYPHSSLVKKIDLANIHAKSNSGLAEAEQIYEELLESDLEPADRQMLYNQYAKHLFFNQNDSKTSIEYHMKAAEIPEKTFFQENSIKVLEKIEERSSADQSQSTPKSKVDALQCHFTWNINPSMSKLLRVKDKLEDIGADEGNSWLAHIYNLQGYIHYKLGLNEDAKSFFSRAADVFQQRQTASHDGPWLMVNYGNQAWLHHHLGEEAESQEYLSKVDALMNEYPPPSQDELHPEIYAEKAWTLMKFSRDKTLVSDYFEKAIRMQPDMVEWQTSYVLGIVSSFKHSDTGLDADILEKMRNAKEQDPENLYLAVRYLEQVAKKGERIEDEARELAQKILRNPVSSYSGIKALLRVFRYYISVDEAIDLAEEALQKHPDERYLKRCAALCYKWKIIFIRQGRPTQIVIDRATSLLREVISLYPHSSLVKKIDLANIHAKSNSGLAEAEQIYEELLESDLEPADRQMLYNQYAKHLFFDRRDHKRSKQYHMKAAEIPEKTFFRANSIKVLEKIEERSKTRMSQRVNEFLMVLGLKP